MKRCIVRQGVLDGTRAGDTIDLPDDVARRHAARGKVEVQGEVPDPPDPDDEEE